MPHRERYFFVCTNRRDEGNPKGSCAAKGSEELVKELKASLLRHQLIGRMRACSSSCLDLCEVGASIVVEPDHVTYGHVTVADVEEIVTASEKGEVVARLVVHPKA